MVTAASRFIRNGFTAGDFIATPRSAPDSLRRAALALGVAGYLGAAVLARPVGVTIRDEVDYYSESGAIAAGLPLADPGSYRPANGLVPFNGPRYPTGWPAVLSLFDGLAWPGPFAAGVLFHLAGAALFALVLRRRGLDPAWALLYLAQPSLVVFSRTLMCEPLATFQTMLLVLLADLEQPLLLGVVAGLSPLVKLSQLIVAAPFGLAWLASRPRGKRLRAFALASLGGALSLGVAAWANERAYGSPLGFNGGPTYALLTALPANYALGLAQLAVAWPLLPLGLWRARAAEAAGALALFVYLGLYGYHYAGPNLAATLVVGARLHTSAIVLLLPGYAALLESFAPRLRIASLALVTVVAIAAPPLLLRSVAARRHELEATRDATFALLRPACSVGYSPFAIKLFVPWPRFEAHSWNERALLAATLDARGCVDLVAPLTEPSTYQSPPTEADPFAALERDFPSCVLERPGALRLVRLAPRGETPDCAR